MLKINTKKSTSFIVAMLSYLEKVIQHRMEVFFSQDKVFSFQNLPSLNGHQERLNTIFHHFD
ncbi:MAG: hypothetical protein AAF573_16780, partial [Bacteroidota bacterium]